MTAPYLGPSFGLHSFAKVTGATGATLDNVNVAGAVRNGPGDYTITLGSEIDPTTRSCLITPRGAGFVELAPGGDTDATLQILTKNPAGAAADVDFEVSIFRTAVPS